MAWSIAVVPAMVAGQTPTFPANSAADQQQRGEPEGLEGRRPIVRDPASKEAPASEQNLQMGRLPPCQQAESADHGGVADAGSSAKTDWLKAVCVGYDDGFVIASSAHRELSIDESPFALRINGWGQFRYVRFESDSITPDLNQFQLQRARLVLSGTAVTPDLYYCLQFDGGSSSGDQVRALDYYVDYDLGNRLWNTRKHLGAKMGKYKMPFSLARSHSGRELQFTDRSMASIFFDVNRSIGAGLHGRLFADAPYYWEFALNNGIVTGGAETGGGGELDDNLAIAMRMHGFPLGEWGEDGLADLTGHSTPAMRIGMGFAATSVDRSGATEFADARVVDSGATLASMLPLSLNSYAISMYAIDWSCKYQGWSSTMEYYFRHINQFSRAPIDDLFDHGFWLQAGYFVVPGKWEVLGRWSRVVGNSGTLGGADQSSDEVAGGFARYWHGQNFKWTFDVTHLNGACVDSSALNIFPGDDGWLCRSQIQVSF